MCDQDHQNDLDKGLTFDLRTMSQRRSRRRDVLKLLVGAAGLGVAVGCGAGGADSAVTGSSATGTTSTTSSSTTSSSTASTTTGTGSTAAAGSCTAIPQETQGPYPADGSNGPNTLSTSGIVRSDIRSSFAGFTGIADGTPVAVQLTVVDVNKGCTPLAGYAVYIWHCDSNGQYSIYENTAANYLRGVQETDATGSVYFTTIFPGCYAGRWPHMHFEVFPSLAVATAGGNSIKTSQLALPSTTCNTVYAQTALYPNSAVNFAGVNLATDNVFSDGYTLQIPEVSGDVANGYTIGLQVGVAV